MKRAILFSLSLVALVWITGCGSSSSGGGTGGPPTPDALSGQYAILLSGFNSNAFPMGMAGSITADGLGHITGGEVDVNISGTTPSTINSLSGTYVFDSTGQGVLGTITLTNTLNNHALVFGFSLQASGNFGNIMDLSANNFIVSGTMEKQSSPILTLAGMAGDYIVTVNGRNSTTPTSELGRLTLAPSGATSNVSFDCSVAGNGTAGPTTGATATVTSVTAPDANGRGTFTLTLNNCLALVTTQNFAYYAITKNRIIALQTADSGSMTASGTMTADFSAQSSPLPATAVTAGSVFGMAGIDPAPAINNEISAVGQLQITGTGPNGTINWDSNDNGTIVGPAVALGQTVGLFDQNTGRGTISIANGNAHGLADTAVFYLTAPGTGFIMDTTAGANNRAMAGTLTAQAAGPFSVATDLGGLGIVRARGTSTGDALSLVGVFGLTTTPGTYALIVDDRQPVTDINNVTTIQTQTDLNVSPITVDTAFDANIGRGTLELPGNGNTFPQVFYVIGPNQFVFIDVTPASTGQNGPSPLFFVSPQ